MKLTEFLRRRNLTKQQFLQLPEEQQMKLRKKFDKQNREAQIGIEKRFERLFSVTLNCALCQDQKISNLTGSRNKSFG